MNKKLLYEKLALSNTESRDITRLKEMMHRLITIVSHAVDEEDRVTHEVLKNLYDESNNIVTNSVSVVKYFSGNGPVATRLREHIEMSLLLDHAMNDEEDEDFDDKHEYLVQLLNDFNFSPDNDKEAVSELCSFIDSVRMYMKENTFNKPVSEMKNHCSLDELRTGIYKAEHSNSNFLLVLSVELPNTDGLKAILIMPTNGNSSMWFYHPIESIWILNYNDYTFDGLKKIFVEHFFLAIADAEPTVVKFDYTLELASLQESIDFIFDNEKLIPSMRLVSYTNGISGFHRDTVDSQLIACCVDDYSLLFRNTNGNYASRSTVMVQSLGDDKMVTITNELVPEEIKKILVDKTKYIIKLVTDEINKVKAERNFTKMVGKKHFINSSTSLH